MDCQQNLSDDENQGGAPQIDYRLPSEDLNTELASDSDADVEMHNGAPNEAHVWKVYLPPQMLLDGWISTLDILLTFAGLFSALATAFVIESYQAFQPDSAADADAALYTLASATNHSTGITLPAPPNLQNASSLARWINGLWFTSLLLSLIVALLGILAKQWIAEYRARDLAPSESPRAWAHRHEYNYYYRYDVVLQLPALDVWPVAELVELLPWMLHLSLFSFFAGVVVFFWTLDTTIGICFIVLGALLAIFYICRTLIPPGARVHRFIREANAHDSVFLDGWSSTLDILVISAVFFSAVTQSFVIESYQLSQPDNAAYTASALYILAPVMDLSTGTVVPAPPDLQYTSSLVRWINGLWFTSILLSFIGALLSILAKQWITEYRARNIASAMSPRDWARALHAWAADLVSLLPVIYCLYVFMILAGWVAFLWTLEAIGTWIIVLGALFAVFCFACTLLSPDVWVRRRKVSLAVWYIENVIPLLPILSLFFAGAVAVITLFNPAIDISIAYLGSWLYLSDLVYALFSLWVQRCARRAHQLRGRVVLVQLLRPRAFSAALAMFLKAGDRLVPRSPTGAEQHELPTTFVVRPVLPLATQQSTSPPVIARAIITTLYVPLSRIFCGRIQLTVSPNADRIRNITHEIHNISCKPVGYGGYSDIYTGMWCSVYGETKVAIKVIRAAPDHSQSGKLPRELRHEISVWKRLLHPNVHVMCGFYEGIGSLPALVSPWYENGDIKEYLRRLAADPDIGILKLRLLGDVMTGLKFLHDQHIVHGDIKGGNVFISDDGVAQLSDFGLSRLLLEHSQSIEQSRVRGTTRWMAPELLLVDGARHSFASDIWAYGCLCIEVWSDVRPYHTKSYDQQVIVALWQNEQPCRPADMPEHLWYIVNECCNADAAARPAPQDIIEYIRLRATTERIFRIALPSRSNDAASGSDVRRQIEERMRGLDSQQISDLWLLLDKELVVEVVRLRIVLPLGC